jgi:hypothetical protein
MQGRDNNKQPRGQAKGEEQWVAVKNLGFVGSHFQFIALVQRWLFVVNTRCLSVLISSNCLSILASERVTRNLNWRKNMTDVFKLIEEHGLTLHGDIEHFAELVRAEAEKQEQKTPLKVLGLTVFTENRLRNGRVYDVETLQAMTNRDILAIPGMGKKALNEVLEALDAYASDISQERVDETAKRKHEPVAWREVAGTVTCYYDYNEDGRGEPLYAAPVAQCTYPKCQVTNGCVGACSKTAPPKQEPYGYFRYDIKLDAWVQNKENTQGVAFYTTPSKPYDPMENNADYERGFIDGRADQMKSSVDKAVNRMAQREWVGLDGDIPDLGLVTEEFYNGMLCAEDILRKRNT